MMMARFQRFGKFRQLHTIISQETIKPSSPTPPHLKTHNLSSLDHFYPHLPVPWVFFYQNFNNRDTDILKKSLSQSLTQYYPFAGRFLTPCASHLECNDEGVEFLEVSHDSQLNDFVLKNEQDESLNHLIPSGLQKVCPGMVEVQLNHFACGGAAVAVTVSHKVADALTMVNFFNHWASITRGECESLINPTFMNSSINETKLPELPMVPLTGKVNYVTRRFVFPNAKLNELKKTINAMGTTSVNPSRVEALISLIFKCAKGAATTRSGSLQPSNLCQMVNIRNKISICSNKLAAGNLALMVTTKMESSDQIQTIIKLRKTMLEVEGITNLEEIGEKLVNMMSTLGDDHSQNYDFSSIRRFPFYQVDFGWGKPVQVMLHTGNIDGNYVVLMDTPSGDGIEATVQLEEQDMTIFRKDNELLAYAHDEKDKAIIRKDEDLLTYAQNL